MIGAGSYVKLSDKNGRYCVGAPSKILETHIQSFNVSYLSPLGYTGKRYFLVVTGCQSSQYVLGNSLSQ